MSQMQQHQKSISSNQTANQNVVHKNYATRQNNHQIQSQDKAQNNFIALKRDSPTKQFQFQNQQQLSQQIFENPKNNFIIPNNKKERSMSPNIHTISNQNTNNINNTKNLTYFQNYLIAKNSSPLVNQYFLSQPYLLNLQSKMQASKLDDDNYYKFVEEYNDQNNENSANKSRIFSDINQQNQQQLQYSKNLKIEQPQMQQKSIQFTIFSQPSQYANFILKHPQISDFQNINSNISSNINTKRQYNYSQDNLKIVNNKLSLNEYNYSNPLKQQQQQPQQFYQPAGITQFQNLPEDYLKIIQDIEDKRSKSKNRFQPSQQPQQNPSIQYTRQPIIMAQQQHPNHPQIPQLQLYNLNNQQEVNVNYLESLYQNQIISQNLQAQTLLSTNNNNNQQIYAQPQIQNLMPLTQQIQQLNINQQNLSGLDLLKFYQQKFNLIQLTQQQLSAQQQQIYQEIQKHYQSNQKTENPQTFQQKPIQFYSPEQKKITPLNQFNEQSIQFNYQTNNPQLQSQQNFQSPRNSTYKRIQDYQQQTGQIQKAINSPFQVEKQLRFSQPTYINQKSASPRPLPQNIDDLYQVINKQVLRDFENKPFSKIKGKYKNISGAQNDLVEETTYQQKIINSSLSRYENYGNMSQRQNDKNLYNRSLNSAAISVQKYLRGYIVRKRFIQFAKLYYFFKRMQKRVLIKNLISTMKDSFISVKNIKTALLKNYVNHCATKIQKLFRGYYARHVIIKIRRAFRLREKILNAVVKGWRIRQIMKTKEIEQMVSQINDYRVAMLDLVGDLSISEKKIQLQRNLDSSLCNSINKLINLIEKMQVKGLWLMYKKNEKKDQKKNESTQNHQKQREIFQVQKNRKTLGSSYKAPNTNFPQSQKNNSSKKEGLSVYVTIENDHSLSQKSIFPKNMLTPQQQEQKSYLQSQSSFKNQQNSNSQNLQPYSNQKVKNFNESNMSINDDQQMLQNKKKKMAYDEIPIKSFSRESKSLVGNSFNLTNSRFEPNFNSDAYKNQAQQIFQRRMHYNPRQAASKSRDRQQFFNNNYSVTQESPEKQSSQKLLQGSDFIYKGVSSKQLQSTIDSRENKFKESLIQYQQQSLQQIEEVKQDDKRPHHKDSSSPIQLYNAKSKNKTGNQFLNQEETVSKIIAESNKNTMNNTKPNTIQTKITTTTTYAVANVTTDINTRRMQRRTREERKKKDQNQETISNNNITDNGSFNYSNQYKNQNDSYNQIEDEIQKIDTNINMFNLSSKGDRRRSGASNLSSTHNLFKKRV